MKFMPWEDVAVGILMQKCGIRLTRRRKSNYDWESMVSKDGTKYRRPNGSWIVHGVSPEIQYVIHNQLPIPAGAVADILAKRQQDKQRQDVNIT